MIKSQDKAARSFLGWREHPNKQFQEKLSAVLLGWEGTRYHAGAQVRGGGVDCVRFVAAVLDELTGRKTPIDKLPPDACFHKPELGYQAAAKIREAYEPTIDVDTTAEFVYPGDVLITGPKDGGPGHAMIVGLRKGEVWHSSDHGVHRTGLSAVFFMGHRIFYCYRLDLERA